MNSLKIFCLSIYNDNSQFFKKLNYVPVGLGDNTYNDDWLLDTGGNNIARKNKYYGEYTFHYWIWKNYLDNLQSAKWIGFSTYRRFWTIKNSVPKNFADLEQNVILDERECWKNSDVILAEKISIGKIKNSKIIKNYGFQNTFSNLNILLKQRHSLYDHFKIFHGDSYLIKAINLLSSEDRNDFENYLHNSSFNPYNLFICRGVKILREYYENIFPWLYRCEDAFDMSRLSGYEIRMLGFLAEHYLSYWFQKKFSVFENCVTFFDTNKYIQDKNND